MSFCAHDQRLMFTYSTILQTPASEWALTHHTTRRCALPAEPKLAIHALLALQSPLVAIAHPTTILEAPLRALPAALNSAHQCQSLPVAPHNSNRP